MFLALASLSRLPSSALGGREPGCGRPSCSAGTPEAQGWAPGLRLVPTPRP